MTNIIHLKRLHPGRTRVRREGRYGRRHRERDAERKLRFPKDSPTPPAPTSPVVANQDERDAYETHAVNHAINVRDTEAAVQETEAEAVAEAGFAAREEELNRVENERQKHAERQEKFEDRVEEQGLGHELAHGSRWPKRLVKGVAAVFETIALATPLQLLGVLDFGTKAGRQLTIGALLALAMGTGYAVVLTVLADGVGQQLKRRRLRHALDGDTSDAEAEGWPRPGTTAADDHVLAVAVGALVLALFAAALVRQVAISILAAAGENQVSISWVIFFLLTVAVYVAVVAVGYWWSRPLADENDWLKANVQQLDTQVDLKRDEYYQLAAKLEICRRRLEAIKGRSYEDQLGQVRLLAAHVFRRRGANPHVYGGLTDPVHVQDVIEHPDNHVRPVQVKPVDGDVRRRIEKVRRPAPTSVAEDAA